ncbi:hydrogenase 4 subunit B [Sedimenticola thiotaurini]|uniref:Hydantoin racemase n=1 Tax=Sedimenticola thiotaurini TaxID=1543721 RepID=A0A0F7K2Y2_9GAMM|nr:hydrogenase 4 subunit B [Sedimenticola thiotaurini]AKH21560.1 hydantoin racemase [Sedimenticola thiotaurini]
MPDLSVATLLGASFCLLFAAALSALLVGRRRAWITGLVFPLMGLSGLATLLAAGPVLLGAPGFSTTLPLGLPWLPWHLHMDALSAFFLSLIGLGVFASSLFGPGYIREYQRGPYSLRLLGLMTMLFIIGMQLVLLADDAFSFLIAWELMSVSSYFLVAFQHHQPANRRAAFLYLLMAQIGAVLILLSFGIFASFAQDFTFDAFRQIQLSPVWASVAFTLGLLGFGMKAGIFPLHAWLPEAHPVAPSHISALMSGVMLKVAIYGFVRMTFDLIGTLHSSWGVVLLVVGSITALFGVLYALMQNDVKRLLAYSSVENVGIIFIGLGLSVLFIAAGHPKLGSLGLIAALYHALSHTLFKSLLFLGVGTVLQQTHEHDMGKMGGLIHRMPWTALFFLCGCISISALPPFTGFVSEWLTFQTALQATILESGVLRAVIPITAAMLALTGALAATCFVKLYGVVFLGQPRSRRVKHAREGTRGMLWAQGLLAGLCLVFGVLGTSTVTILGRVAAGLTGSHITAATAHGWIWLTPVKPEVASYSGPMVLFGISLALLTWGSVYLLLCKHRKLQPIQRGPAWGCGFGRQTANMQYSGTGFVMPIKRVFRPVWRLQQLQQRELSNRLASYPKSLSYQLQVEDITWRWLYQPAAKLIQFSSRKVGRLQTGNLRHYLVYSFVTLVVLLWLIS